MSWERASDNVYFRFLVHFIAKKLILRNLPTNSYITNLKYRYEAAEYLKESTKYSETE